MFDNIGGKIKTLAKVLMWISIAGFAVWGIWMISQEQVLIGFLIIAIGGLSSWVSSFVLYGFGQLVESSEKVAYYAKGTTPVYKRETTQLAKKLAEANKNEQVKKTWKTWKCKCGFENPEHADSCCSCGEYK